MLFFGKNRASGAAGFWEWLQGPNGAATVSDMRLDPPRGQTAVNEIGKRFRKAYPGLSWGISGVGSAEHKCFEISAGGISSNIPAVRAAVAAAPDMSGWTVVAFAQPTRGFALMYKDCRVDPETVLCQVMGALGPKVDLQVFLPLPSDTPPKLLAEMGFLVLDHSLGEEIVMTRLNHLSFETVVVAPPTAISVIEMADQLRVG